MLGSLVKILDSRKSSIRNICCNQINIFMPKSKKCRVVVLNGKATMLKHSNHVFQLKVTSIIILMINLLQIIPHGLSRAMSPHVGDDMWLYQTKKPRHDSSIKHIARRRRRDILRLVSVRCWCNIRAIKMDLWCNIRAINMAPKVFSLEEKFKLKSPRRVIVACKLDTHWCSIHCK